LAAAGETLHRETGATVLAHAADLSDADAIARWHAATRDRLGDVDLLFTNTGGPPPGGALSFDDAAWRTGFELLVLSVVRMVRAVVPSMQARGGGGLPLGAASAREGADVELRRVKRPQ